MYEITMLREAHTWQQVGEAALDTIPEAAAATAHEALDRKVAALGAMAVGLYDMVGAEWQAARDPRRPLVAQQGVILGAVCEMADDVVDRMGPTPSAFTAGRFLKRVRTALLDDAEPAVVPEVLAEPLQLSAYAAARRAHHMIGGSALATDAVRILTGEIEAAELESLSCNNVSDLLNVTQRATGSFLQLIMLPEAGCRGWATEQDSRAAWQLGAVSGVLDHGSEVVQDMRAGTATFATAYLRQHGVSQASLRAVTEMRRTAAAEAYQAGLQSLAFDSQRQVFKGIARLLYARYALKRWQGQTNVRELARAEAAYAEAV